MYYPYLYGRGEELLALRAVAPNLVGWRTVPVIEPVAANPASLVTCLEFLAARDAHCYAVVNPAQLDFRRPVKGWWSEVGRVVASLQAVRPAFMVHSAASAADLGAFLDGYKSRPVAIVLRSADLPADDLAQHVAGRDVVVFVHNEANPKPYLRALPAEQAVRVEQSFFPKERNADYSDGQEWFSSGHLEFGVEGRLGYSDFGPLGPKVVRGGGQPAAIAIHLTYRHDDGSLWIQHFVSDSFEAGDGDTESKMLEAIAKIAAQVNLTPARFEQSLGLSNYLEQHKSQTVTSLGKNKRQQLIHHLHTAGTAVPAGSRV